MRLGLQMTLFLPFVLAVSALAGSGTTWHGEHPFDTGYFATNGDQLEPIVQEPTEWDRVNIPLPPDGADEVRTKITRIEYGVLIRCANVSDAAASYMTSGLYTYRVGHRAGIYSSNGHLYLAGHGHDMNVAIPAQVAAIGAGGGNAFVTVQPSEIDENGEPIPDVRAFSTAFDTNLVDIRPMSPEWVEPNRRGAHTLFATVAGSYSWGWVWNNGVPPPGWGSHSPLTYTLIPWARVVGTIEFGSYPAG